MFNDIEIKAADWVISIATLKGQSTSGLSGAKGGNKEVLNEMSRMADYLQRDGLILVTPISGGYIYKLTPYGDEFKRSGKQYADFLAAKSEKEENDIKKEKRKDQHQELQIEKLLIELNVIKDMQDEQRKFWQSGIDRDKRQRWQFWLTLMVAGAAFILSIINFIKTMILP